jgi:hypothetical protein
MPIALQGLDEQVATDRTRDAAHHVLPGTVAVLKVGRDSDGDTHGKTDPRFRECAGGRRSKPSCKSPRAWIVLHGTWGEWNFSAHGRTGESKNEKHCDDILHVRLFPGWDLMLLRYSHLGKIKTCEYGQRACCLVHLPKFRMQANVLLLEAVAFVGTVRQETQAV